MVKKSPEEKEKVKEKTKSFILSLAEKFMDADTSEWQSILLEESKKLNNLK